MLSNVVAIAFGISRQYPPGTPNSKGSKSRRRDDILSSRFRRRICERKAHVVAVRSTACGGLIEREPASYVG